MVSMILTSAIAFDTMMSVWSYKCYSFWHDIKHLIVTSWPGLEPWSNMMLAWWGKLRNKAASFAINNSFWHDSKRLILTLPLHEFEDSSLSSTTYKDMNNYEHKIARTPLLLKNIIYELYVVVMFLMLSLILVLCNYISSLFNNCVISN